MAEQAKPHMHLSRLIAEARQKKGFSTLKELYRVKQPSVDYQTWLHAEAGRRLPHPSSLIEIGTILDIDRETLLITYCKDKFPDQQSHKVLDSFQNKQFLDVEAMIDAKVHDRTDDYVFTADQVKAIQEDIRLRLYLLYTYDKDFKTTFARLANFFHVEKDTVKDVVDRLQSLGLVEVIGEEVKRIHRHTTMPKTVDVFDLRRQLLLKSLDLNVKPDSYIFNYHVFITEESFKQFLAYLDFAEANLVKLDKEDQEGMNKARFQIAIVANRIKEGIEDDRR